MGRRLARRTDDGQMAIITVVIIIAVIALITTTLTQIMVDDSPLISADILQHYAARGVQSGIDALQADLQQHPDGVVCDVTDTTCTGIQYGSWIQVQGPRASNIATYFLFEHPVPTMVSGAMKSATITVLGVATAGSRDSFDEATVTVSPGITPLADALWTNFNATPLWQTTGSVGIQSGQCEQCAETYGWYMDAPQSPAGAIPGEVPVEIRSEDSIDGPIFSNDAIYVSPTANLGSDPITTHDACALRLPPTINGSGSTASWNISSSVDSCGPSPSLLPASFTGAATGPLTVNAPLESFTSVLPTAAPVGTQAVAYGAIQSAAWLGGCDYLGPVVVTLTGSTFTATDPLGTTHASGNTATCPTNGSSAPLPPNGVIFDQTDNGATGGWNPLADTTQAYSNVCNGTVPVASGEQAADDPVPVAGGQSTVCAYSTTGAPPATVTDGAYLYVSGDLSGRLTIGSAQNITVDGNITYDDCAWTGTPSQSTCPLNTNGKPNDALALVSGGDVSINHPYLEQIGNIATNWAAYAPTQHTEVSPYPACGASGSLAAPLCNGLSSNGSITIDASITALGTIGNGSLDVPNLGFDAVQATASAFTLNSLSRITIYGSLVEYNAGITAMRNLMTTGFFAGAYLGSGMFKQITWDPRLPANPPPNYPELSYQRRWDISRPLYALPTSCPKLTTPYWDTSASSTCPAVP